MRRNAPPTHRQSASFANYAQSRQTAACIYSTHLAQHDQTACAPNRATTRWPRSNPHSSANCAPKFGQFEQLPYCGSNACEINHLRDSQILAFYTPSGEMKSHAQSDLGHAQMGCDSDPRVRHSADLCYGYF